MTYTVLSECKSYWRRRITMLLRIVCADSSTARDSNIPHTTTEVTHNVATEDAAPIHSPHSGNEHADTSAQITEEMLVVQNVHNSAFGDIAFPLFSFAKNSSLSPSVLSAKLHQMISQDDADNEWGRTEAAGGYLNVRLNRATIINRMFGVGHHAVVESPVVSPDAVPYAVCRTHDYVSQKICVEYSSPNTNKPLHLGHLRNNVLGESISRILERCGAEVVRINLINDRGIHICKSMAAYQKFGNDTTPSDMNVRPDTFVGDYYVRFDRWQQNDTDAMVYAQQLLIKWEQGDAKTRQVWEKMRRWVLDGIMDTYRRTGIQFDVFQYESETYMHGKEIVQQGLKDNIFRRTHDHSIEIDLSDAGLDVKTLLRGDGTAIYITQDLGTIMQRYRAWKFDQAIYVVANEQEYHFRALFEIVSRLNLPFASHLFHRSYGLVHLPDGRMKSREGTVVDADALIDEVRNAVRAEMHVQNRYLKEQSEAQRMTIAEKIAISSIHYWLLKVDPHKNITFDTKKSISFNGNSGAYILYMITRMRHLIMQGETCVPNDIVLDKVPFGSLLTHDLEWRIVFSMAQFQETISDAARDYSPFPISQYVYALAQLFSRYYHDVPIATAQDVHLRCARLQLIKRLHAIFEQCCYFLVMPTVTNM